MISERDPRYESHLAVLREAGRWGVPVVTVSQALLHERRRRYEKRPVGRDDTWRQGPFWGGIEWNAYNQGMVLWPSYTTFYENRVAEDRQVDKPEALFHEIAHCVVGVDPEDADEEEAMLAIEHEAHQRLRLHWSDWMFNYGTSVTTANGNGAVWSRLSSKSKSYFLAHAYDCAEAMGLMKNKKPTYARRESR